MFLKDRIFCQGVCMKSPIVSIIVPTADTSIDFYEKLISIVQQDLYPVELLIIHKDKKPSKNQSAELKKAGIAHALFYESKFNFKKLKDYITQKCSGKYIMVLSDKDEFEPQFLQRMVNKAELSDADIVFCDFTRFNEQTSIEENVNWSIKNDFLPMKAVFNASDCPDTIFNITPLGIRNKLYKRKFLTSLEYEISDETEGFLAFAMETFSEAKRITCVNDKLFSWHKDEKTDIRQDINKERSLVKEFGDVYYFLMKTEKEVILQKSFTNYFTQKIYFWYLRLGEPFKSFWETFAAFQVSHYFDVESQDKSYFYNPDAYRWVSQLALKQNLSPELEKVYLSDKKDVVPVVMAINNDYMLYAGVTIQSIKEHASRDKFYDIYVMYTWLEPSSIRKLESLSDEQFRITCINVDSYLKGYSFEDKMNRELWHISKETYYRFLIADLFPGYDQVIYLDADLIVRDDLAKLHGINLGKNLLGGCYNSLYGEEYRQMETVLKIDPLSYINAGVLLMNAKLWRDEKVGEQCFQALSKYGTTIKYQDQDILNIVCHYRIQLIDYRWNFIYSLYTLKNPDYMRFLSRNNFQTNSLKIIHYTWWQKPWVCPENEMADIWWDYAKKSPFYEAILLKRIKIILQENNHSGESPDNPVIVNNVSSKEIIKNIQKGNSSVYPLLSQYIKESVLFLMTWGEKRKYHSEKLSSIKALIEKGIQ